MSKREIKFLVGIYATLMSLMAVTIPVSVLEEIGQTFPHIPDSVVQMLVACPALFGILTNLTASKVAHLIHKKYLAIASMILFILGGVFPFFFHGSFACLMTSTVLVGFAMGGIQNTGTTIICDYFEGDKRALTMGLMSAFIGIGGVIYTFVASRLGAIQWHYAYLAYLCMIPLLVLQIFCMPTGVLEEKPTKGNRVKVPSRVIWICFFAFFLYTISQTYNSNISMLVAERGIGSVTEAGTATSIYNIAVMVAGLMLVPFMKMCKKFSLTGIFLFSVVGCVCLMTAQNMVLIILGAILMAISYGMFTPFMNNLASEASLPMGLAFNLALGSCIGAAGQSASPFTTSFVSNLLGGGMVALFGAVIALGIFMAALAGWIFGGDRA